MIVVKNYGSELSYCQDIRDVAKSVNSSLIQLVKPEDGLTIVTTPDAGTHVALSTWIGLLVTFKLSSHFHGLDAGNVTVFTADYPWDIHSGSIDKTVMFQDQPSRFCCLGFSVA